VGLRGSARYERVEDDNSFMQDRTVGWIPKLLGSLLPQSPSPDHVLCVSGDRDTPHGKEGGLKVTLKQL